MKSPPSFWRALALISGLAGAGPLLIDVFLPAMPQAADALGVGIGDIQITIGWLMAGTALGHLIYGPLADRYGRRPVILWSMALFTLASFLTAIAPTIGWLYGGRFLLGFLTASAMIIMRAIVRDLYTGPMAAKLLAYAFVTGGMMPILAPILGGYLTNFFGWPATLIAAGLYGLVLTLALWLYLDETGTPDISALDVRAFGRSAVKIVTNKRFVAFTLATSAPFGGLFAILTGLSPALISQLGVSPPYFGFMFAIIMTGNFSASIAAGRLSHRFNISQMALAGATCCAAAGAAIFVATKIWPVSVTAIVAPAFVFMVGFALLMPAAMAGAMAPFSQVAGRASSIMGLANLGTGAITAFLLGIYANDTHGPMVTALLVSGLATLIICLALPKGDDTSTPSPPSKG